jgi:tetratricopeptide (TPR) repeat protein
MQHAVFERYEKEGCVAFDCAAQEPAPDFRLALVEPLMAADPPPRAVFVLNLHAVLRTDNEIYNFNFNRDLYAKQGWIWFWCVTPELERRLMRLALDYYSFVRLKARFEDDPLAVRREAQTTPARTPPQRLGSWGGLGERYTGFPPKKHTLQMLQDYEGMVASALALDLGSAPRHQALSAATTLTNAARLLNDAEEYGRALELLERVRETRERLLDEGAKETMDTYRDIATVYENLGDGASALAWYGKAPPFPGALMEFGGYAWRVLDVQGGKALLITRDIIDVRPYHPYNPYHPYHNSMLEEVTWEGCALREWLNGEFLVAFQERDRARVAATDVANEDNPWFGTPGGNDTRDRAFLLSINEVVKYFGDSGALEAGRLRNQKRDESLLCSIKDRYNCARAAVLNVPKEGWDSITYWIAEFLSIWATWMAIDKVRNGLPYSWWLRSPA